MTSKIPKRLGALFLSLALCLTMLPATALAAAGDVTYLYCDTNGASWTTDTKRSDEYTVVTDNTTSWGSKSAETWLVVNSNVTISERITVTGDVHLILMDNCNLTASQGITVEDGDSLTIYAQSDGDGMGALIANGSWAAAGIGGTDGASAGNITICGGSIKAQGGYANSGGGAGIGGGTNGSGGTISIYGGKVDASADGGAGIGSGFKNKSDITTNGGTITITGGVVSTYSEWGACIGGGYASGNGSFSTGTDGNAIIFATGPRTKIADETNKSSWSGIVFAYSSWDAHTGTVYGASVELTSDFEVPNGVTLTIPNGSTLTIPRDMTLTNSGSITVESGAALTNNGTIDGEGTITGGGSFAGNKIAQSSTPSAPMLSNRTSDTITLTSQSGGKNGVEYKCEMGAWQTGTNFSSLSPGTAYTFYARYAGNTFYSPSDSSSVTTIYTLPAIVTTSLPGGTVGVAYSQMLAATASDGTTVTWSIEGDTLPEGLTLSNNTISGTPTKSGNFTFTVKATINGDVSSTKELSIAVGKGDSDITLTVKKGDSAASEFTYGDTITIEGTIQASSTAPNTNVLAEPSENQAVLFWGDTQLTEPVAVDSSGKFTITYATSGKGITPSGNQQTLTVKYGGGDNLNDGTATTSITLKPKPVTAQVVGSITKAYDGETDAAVTLQVDTSDLVNVADAVAVTAPNAAYANAGVGTHDISFGGLTVSAADAAYYAVTASPESVTGSITAKTLTPSITGNTSKTYDGTTDAPEGLGITLSGVVGGDDVTATANFAYDSAEVGDAKTITASNITLDGIDKGNYTLSSVTATISGSITARPSTGGGGGITTKPSYPPTVSKPDEGGDMTISPSRPQQGDKVTIQPKPNPGYEVDEIIVKDKDGNTVPVKKDEDGNWSFTQPSSKVTIEVTFREIQPEPAPLPFTDVPKGAWYEDAVRYVYENGLMNGTSETEFSPNATTSRSQIVTILWRIAGSPVVNYLMDFDDVDANAYYVEAIRWATSEGIVGGYGGGVFGPDDAISREQFAVMLYNFSRKQGYDVSASADLSSYTDRNNISGYALEAMRWANDAGIIGGTSPTTLYPQGTATRAQAAAMLMRFCQKYIER